MKSLTAFLFAFVVLLSLSAFDRFESPLRAGDEPISEQNLGSLLSDGTQLVATTSNGVIVVFEMGDNGQREREAGGESLAPGFFGRMKGR